MQSYTTTDVCRVCGSKNLLPLFSLGNHYVNNFPGVNDDDGPQCPIDLEMCDDCTLVQLKHNAPQELLYSRHYWYRSGVTETMRQSLRDITRDIQFRTRLRSGDVALDIGSNDGTLLRSYEIPWLIKVGVEPANNLIEAGKVGVDRLIHDFWNFQSYWGVMKRHANVITAIGMFYDLESPNEFIADVAKALAPNGTFVAQLMCLRNMLNIGDVGNLCHEHLEYYSLKSLKCLLGKHGLEIFDMTVNSVNGESYRFYIRHASSQKLDPKAEDRIRHFESLEQDLDKPIYYAEFFRHMEANKARVVNCLRSLKEQGKLVYGYGASTKGNTILQYYCLNTELITAIADRSPEKHGRYTVGTRIPIVSNEAARAAKPDYFFVLPYAFLSEFTQVEHEWRTNGGRFIVPLPELRIV